jgi:DNA-binding winged helix-turn-helix (wHTH) protein
MKIGIYGNNRFLTRILSSIIAEDDHAMFHSRYWSVFEESAKKNSFAAMIYLCADANSCPLSKRRCLKLSHALRVPSILIYDRSKKPLKRDFNQDNLHHLVGNPFYPIEILALLRQFADREPRVAVNHLIPNTPWLQESELAPKLYFDRANNCITRNGLKIYLSPREGRLLEILMQKEGEIVSFDELFQSVWKTEEKGSYDSLYVIIRSLKKKLTWDDHDQQMDLIQNVYGVGYTMKSPDISYEACCYE